MLHVEDFAEGRTFDLGACEVTEEGIVGFAERYDPQPFHVDPEAARASHFGGLVASGWHTCAMAMRLMVDGLFGRTAGMGSPGIERIRWPLPVRPGDVLRARAEVLSSRLSRSRPGAGIVRLRCEARNAGGETVLEMETTVFVARRPEGA